MKKNLFTLLAEGEVVVNFIKDDGSERVMRATTNTNLINYTKKKSTYRKPKNIITVWDLDINQWRSIREDRILGWTEKTSL